MDKQEEYMYLNKKVKCIKCGAYEDYEKANQR